MDSKIRSLEIFPRTLSGNEPGTSRAVAQCPQPTAPPLVQAVKLQSVRFQFNVTNAKDVMRVLFSYWKMVLMAAIEIAIK
jgi:hypothetical protein